MEVLSMGLTNDEYKEVREIVKNELWSYDHDLKLYHIEPLKRKVRELETLVKALLPNFYKPESKKDVAKIQIIQMLQNGIKRNKDLLEKFNGSNKLFYEAMDDLINRGVVKKYKKGKCVYYELIENED
jgi:predicted transcriptional regulator